MEQALPRSRLTIFHVPCSRQSLTSLPVMTLLLGAGEYDFSEGVGKGAGWILLPLSETGKEPEGTVR